MIPIARHSDNSEDWLENFLKSSYAEKTTRKIKADYLSRVRQHIEDQKSKGTYISVESALEDYTRRLNLDRSERKILAELVREGQLANIDNPTGEDNLKKEIEEQGAPASILPGVKPDKKTNKQTIKKDLAEDIAGEDVDGETVPLAMSAETSSSRTVYAEEISNREFVFKVDSDPVYIDLRVEKLGNGTARWYLSSKKKQEPDVLESKTHQLVEVQRQLHQYISAQMEDSFKKTMALQELRNFEDWLKIPLGTPRAEETPSSPLLTKEEPSKEEKKKGKKEEDEEDWIDNLEDVKLPTEQEEEQEEEGEAEVEEKKSKIPKSGLGGLNLKGISLTGKQEAAVTGKTANLLNLLTPETGELAKNYKSALRKKESLDEKFTNLMGMRNRNLKARSLITFYLAVTEKGKKTLDQVIEETRTEIDEEAGKVSPNMTTIEVYEQRLQRIEDLKAKFPALLSMRGLNANDPNLAQKLGDLKQRLKASDGRIRGELENVGEELSQNEHEILRFSTEDDRRKLAEHLKTLIPQIVPGEKMGDEFADWFKKLTKFESVERQALEKNLKQVFDVNDRRQAKLVSSLQDCLAEDYSGTPEEMQPIFKAFAAYPGFLTVRPEHLTKAYQGQLEQDKPVVPRKKNQARQGGAEYVISIVGNRRYRGYLPTEELTKAAPFLLYGKSEEAVFTENREKARDFIEKQRRVAISQLQEAGERSLLSNLAQLYSKAYELNDPVAREQYDKLLEEARKRVDPDLRGYLIHPTRPVDEVIDNEMLREVVDRVLVPESLEEMIWGDPNKRNQETDDLTTQLERIALSNGYALESYDITLAEHVNEIYIAQCSRFTATVTRRRNAYWALYDRTSQNAFKKADGEAQRLGLTLFKGNLTQEEAKEATKIVRDAVALFDKTYLKELEKGIRQKKKESGEVSKGIKSIEVGNPYRNKAKEVALELIEQAPTKLKKAAQTAFTKAIEAREKQDATILKNYRKYTDMTRLGEATSLVFGSLAGGSDFKVVTPDIISEFTLSPTDLRKGIYEEAASAGKQLTKFQANSLLRRALLSFWSDAAGEDVEAFTQLTKIFPVYEKEEKALRETYQQSLSDAAEVAAHLDARGVIIGGERPIFIFETLPVGSESYNDIGYDIKLSKFPKGIEAHVSLCKLSVTGQVYPCWVGNEAEIQKQIDEVRRPRQSYVARYTDAKDIDKRADFLVENATDVEATSLMSKSIHKETSKVFDFSLKEAGLSFDEAKQIWDQEVVQIIRDPENPLMLKQLPGPPKSRWGKKGSANFMLESNSWKIGRKSAIYQNLEQQRQEALDKMGVGKTEQRQLKQATRQLSQLDRMLRFVANYSSKTRATVPTAEAFLGKVFDKKKNAKKLARINYLLDIMQGKTEDSEITKEDAIDRLLKFIQKRQATLRREKKNLRQNGKDTAIIELVCPNEHIDRTFETEVTYIVGRTNQALLNGATVSEIGEIFDWAQEAIQDPTTEDEQTSLAARYRQDRFLIVGKKPTCPVCGFHFHNVDMELSEKLSGESGQRIITTPSGYLEKIKAPEAKESFDWVVSSIRYLTNPANKDVVRKDSPFDMNQIEQLSIVKADIEWGQQARVPRPEGVRLPMVREILTGQDLETKMVEGKPKQVDLYDTPYSKTSPVLGQLEWQVQLLEILYRWKKELMNTYAFRDEVPVAVLAQPDKFGMDKVPEWKERLWKDEAEKQAVQRSPIFVESSDGLSVGYVNNKPVLFKKEEEVQLGFYYDQVEEDEQAIVPKGVIKRQADKKVMKRRGDNVIALFQFAEMMAVERLRDFIQKKTVAGLVASIHPAGLKTGSLLKKDAAHLTDLLERIEKGEVAVNVIESLKDHLQAAFGDLLVAEPKDWAELAGGAKDELVLRHRLHNKKLDERVAQTVDTVMKTDGSIRNDRLLRMIDGLRVEFNEISEEIARAKQEDLLKGWDWLTNKIIRLKGHPKAVQEQEVPTEIAESKTKAQFRAETIFSKVREMFNLNDFPETEEDRRKYGLGEEGSLLSTDPKRAEAATTDNLLTLVKRMLKKFSSERVKIGEVDRRVGSLEKIVNRFINTLMRGLKVDATTFRRLEEGVKDVREMIVWGDYGYSVESSEEVMEDIRLQLGGDLFENEQAKTLLTEFSEQLADAIKRMNELLEIETYLSSRELSLATTRPTTKQQEGPDPRFFYRVVKVVPEGLKKQGGVQITLPDVDANYAQRSVTVQKRSGEREEKPSVTRTTSISEARSWLSRFESHFAGKDHVAKFKELYGNEYEALLYKYAMAAITGQKSVSGSVVLKLEPVVSDKDEYYTAMVGDSTGKRVKTVPEEAARATEYRIPLEYAKQYMIPDCETMADLRKAYEECFSQWFDFAEVWGEGENLSTVQEAHLFNSIRRIRRTSQLSQLLAKFSKG